MKKSLLAGFAGALLALALVGQHVAIGAGTPANKAVASGSKVVAFAPGLDVPLMSASMKTSAPTDLLLEVNLECSILTHLITGGEGLSTDSATATGDIRIWVEFDGKKVPINSIGSGAGAEQIGDDTDKVTFCNRTYSRTVTDTEDQGDNDPDGLDEEDDYISTKGAHSFRWVRLNTGSGMHTIVVKADLSTETAGDAVAEAYVGNRTLIVEPTKMANNAVV
jgi:hypothetical protein